MRAGWRGFIGAAILAVGGAEVCGAFARGSAAPAIEGLQAWLDGTRDLECRFEQRLVSSALGAGTRESGRLRLKRPGRLRWDYTDPEPKTAIVEGERTLLYLPEDRQLVRGSLSSEQGLVPSLLIGSGRIVELFEATVLGDGGSGAAGVRVKLVPRSAPDGMEEVILSLRVPGFAIERAEVLDPAGSRMEYVFTRMRRNAGLPDAAFAFEPPPGTEIVESSP